MNKLSKGLLGILKNAYSKPSWLFIITQLSCLVIFFFVLDKNTGGSLFKKSVTVSICILVGGYLSAIWSFKRDGDPIQWFRIGANSLLVFATLVLWAGNGKYDENGVYHSGGAPSRYDGYPKSCKAGCGHQITSSQYDCEGYHCTCVPGKDGESIYNKSRRY